MSDGVLKMKILTGLEGDNPHAYVDENLQGSEKLTFTLMLILAHLV